MLHGDLARVVPFLLLAQKQAVLFAFELFYCLFAFFDLLFVALQVLLGAQKSCARLFDAGIQDLSLLFKLFLALLFARFASLQGGKTEL